ncbi:215_t:CDS:2 [Diversispora eburnea]|uniref:215_t:CDS:1 n=1 Tax=Diversispora eburnea TaxID=1213867 RepID=A0A9N9FSA3_9GLOM|nr:215_t:CDS:2 [Diversispora eburnea]
MTTTFKTVAIAGATGKLGYPIAEAFLNDGSYKIKILRQKPENKNERAELLASKGAEIVYVDYTQKDDLVKALKGTDVIVSTLAPNKAHIDFCTIQIPLLNAAKEAGVKRFIPSEFGGEYTPGAHPFINSKIQFREELEKNGIEYTYIFTGIFQEFIEMLGFDLKNKTVTFYVDGDPKIHSTSLADIGKYTVESLKLPEARNATIRVAGSTFTIKEILQKFEEATGSKWKIAEDKEVRHRFRNQIEPIPSIVDDFRVFILENGTLSKLDNDKFSFTPRSLTEQINTMNYLNHSNAAIRVSGSTETLNEILQMFEEAIGSKWKIKTFICENSLSKLDNDKFGFTPHKSFSVNYTYIRNDNGSINVYQQPSKIQKYHLLTPSSNNPHVSIISKQTSDILWDAKVISSDENSEPNEPKITPTANWEFKGYACTWNGRVFLWKLYGNGGNIYCTEGLSELGRKVAEFDDKSNTITIDLNGVAISQKSSSQRSLASVNDELRDTAEIESFESFMLLTGLIAKNSAKKLQNPVNRMSNYGDNTYLFNYTPFFVCCGILQLT